MMGPRESAEGVLPDPQAGRRARRCRATPQNRPSARADGRMTERPLIIVGCPRSGTTLLSTMLHAHPRIAVPPETRWLRATYQRRRAFGDLRVEANRHKLASF